MSMKLHPILFGNHISKQNFSTSPLSKNPAVSAQRQLVSGMPAFSPANFKGQESAVFARDLRNLHGIHCPICGVEMLSLNDFQNTIREGESIKDPGEFASWIEGHSENLNKSFKKIPDSAQKAAQSSDVTDIDSMLDFMREDAYAASRKVLNSLQRRINEARETQVFSDSDNVLLDESLMRLESLDVEKTHDLLKDVKTILQDTIGNLENDSKWGLYMELKEPVKEAGFYQHLFFYDKDKLPNINRQRQFLQKMFFLSSAVSQNIVTNFEEDRDLKANVILTCKCCNKPRGEQLFKHFKDEHDLKKNYVQYVDDVGARILDGELKGSSDYPIKLVRFVNKLSRGELNIDKYENETLRKVLNKRFGDLHERVNFAPVAKRGIPCATCGKDTITHEERLEIFDEIKDAKNIRELMDILEDNWDLVRPGQKALVRYWALNLKHEPDISEAVLLKNLRNFSANQIKGQLRKSINIVKSSMKNLNDSDRALVEVYLREAEKLCDSLPASRPFSYDVYSNLLKNTIYNVEDDGFRNRNVVFLKEPIRRLFSTHMLLYPNDATIKKVGSTMKVITQNIMKGSVATIDYLVPISKNGWENKENAVVMCKNCNHEKTSYSLSHWHELHPELAQNMQKYIDRIVSLIKSGELKDMDKYPFVIASSVKTLTNGKIVLHFNLPKKDV